jgi:hypothetical protein
MAVLVPTTISQTYTNSDSISMIDPGRIDLASKVNTIVVAVAVTDVANLLRSSTVPDNNWR